MFANRYFSKNGQYQPLICQDISPDTGMFVMIPCFREPNILLTLESLRQCDLAGGTTEVFVIINEPEVCDKTISEFNNQTYHSVKLWMAQHSCEGLRFFTSPPVRLPKKWAGVGMARKRGMDEGLWRFNQLNRKNGIIVSLDADTLVDVNYLTSIGRHFAQNPAHAGATIAFSHQLDGIGEKQRIGILLYEKYMKYYKQALTFAGYPNSLFTIGSAFAVTADAYMKRGGMTRRKAGEDFYFLQTLPQVGKVGEITDTEVHPSARSSDRVPFGTGPAMGSWMSDQTDLRYTYNLQAFHDLKIMFSRFSSLYRISPSDYDQMLEELPLPVAHFLKADNFFREMNDLSGNCATPEMFADRFFHLFNAFRILKFIHFSHREFYEKRLLDEVWAELQTAMQ